MNNSLALRYLSISLALHIALMFLCYFGPSDNTIHKKFLVLGAHSQKISSASYKRLEAIPFVNEKPKQPEPAKKAVETKSVVKELPKPEPIKQQEKTKPTPKLKPTTLQKELPKKSTKQETKKLDKKPVEKKPDSKPKPELTTQPVPAITPATGLPKIAASESLEEPLHLIYGDPLDEKTRVYQKTIQRTIAKIWQPPVGVPKGTECSLIFVVNKQGLIEKFEILQRSDILVYDLSIVRVAQQFKFHRCLWGKKFTVDFRQ
ncbi:hypothetical protein IPF37_05010 [bacterium]|nr:MAG: hypothetical protein IPF37_05010 [bacterium]